MSSNIVITMARQYGSGGKTIGAMLAKELGINCYSREILRMASEESGINERLFGMSDEKMKGAGWFKILSRPYDGELLPPEDKDFVSEENIFNGYNMNFLISVELERRWSVFRAGYKADCTECGHER